MSRKARKHREKINKQRERTRLSVCRVKRACDKIDAVCFGQVKDVKVELSDVEQLPPLPSKIIVKATPLDKATEKTKDILRVFGVVDLRINKLVNTFEDELKTIEGVTPNPSDVKLLENK